MNIYKIFKEGHYFFQNFATLEEAQTFAQSVGVEYSAELTSEEFQIQPLTLEQRYEADVQFGQMLIKEFILENRTMTITSQQSIELMQIFGSIKQLCEVGSLSAVYAIIDSITISDVFTQERKDKYKTMISSYLNSY